MKRIIPGILAATLLTAASCSKNNNTTTTPTTPASTIPADGWILKGVSYKSQLGFTDDNMVGVTDAIPSGSNPQVNNFAAHFKTLPTTAGTYKIVFWADNDSLATDEVGISATIIASNSTYMCTGTDGKTATVTMVNGKIKVEVPEIKVFTVSPSPDTTTLTGTILQTM